MSAIYDNWERLVAAVLKKEQFRQLCYADSLRGDSVSSSAYYFGSQRSDFAAASGILTPNQQSRQKNPFRFLEYNSYESSASNFEVLRKENLAIPYRSVVDNGITTVVKRLSGASISPSTIRNDSGVYFTYEDEMLIIYEYQSQVNSTSNLLRGKPMFLLDWESRLRVAVCVARAIATTHGELTSTTNSPNSHDEDHFSDLYLENMAASSVIVSSYRAPEVNCTRDLSKQSDVYSFGVILLELLTIKFPAKGNNVGNRQDLVRWVTRKFVEAGTLVVFEFVPVGNPRELIQMWRILLVAIRCVEDDPEMRPEFSQVLRMMEDIKSVHLKNGN